MRNINQLVKKAWTFIKHFGGRCIKDNVSVFAAQASFFLIISSIPFIMLLLALSQYAVPFSKDEVMLAITKHTSPLIVGFASHIINELFDKSVSLLSVTALTTMWSASRGVMSLIQGLDNIYMKDASSNYIRERAASIFYTLIFIVSLIICVVLMLIGQKAQAFMAQYIPLLNRTVQFILNFRGVLLVLALAFVFTVIYTFLPGQKKKFVHQIPGGIFSAMGWFLFSKTYSIYIDNFSNFSYVYGSLTAIVLLMLWLYFCMIIFLWGAELNEMLLEYQLKKHPDAPFPGSPD